MLLAIKFDCSILLNLASKGFKPLPMKSTLLWSGVLT